MVTKVKPQVFIDHLTVECSESCTSLRLVLKDERGSICRSFEGCPSGKPEALQMKGLNDLPYGVYTLEISAENNTGISQRVVKRV